MSVEVTIPSAGESISEVTLGEWAKREGDAVTKDEVLVQVETDKASVEIPAPVSGTLEAILVDSGADASPGDVVARIARDVEGEPDDDGEEDDENDRDRDQQEDDRDRDQQEDDDDESEREQETRASEEDEHRRGHASGDAGDDGRDRADGSSDEDHETGDEASRDEPADRSSKRKSDRLAPRLTPAVRRALRRSGSEPSEEDLREALDETGATAERREEAVAMSPLRRTIAKRLVQAQQRAALVTTFNEVDMSEVLALRERYRERFERRHGVGLGIMSFFVKAAIEALKAFPGLNAEVREDDIVYKRYYDVGVAVATERGLVVPVLRDAERMSFADIEREIADLAERAGRGDLEPGELEGGSFTISNGGVFGSLMSEPIINPPQTGVLGMHAIEDRPVAREGEVVIRPMMYLALTYDHRVVDGREAVQFLKTIRDDVETPARILLEL